MTNYEHKILDTLHNIDVDKWGLTIFEDKPNLMNIHINGIWFQLKEKKNTFLYAELTLPNVHISISNNFTEELYNLILKEKEVRAEADRNSKLENVYKTITTL